MNHLEHHWTDVERVRLHHVSSGSGPPVLLVPGWPQSWFAWRRLVPLLVAAGRRVHVVDPRGFGDSTTSGGNDVESAANDLHLLVPALTPDASLDVVAHDVGTWIAHCWAVTRPEQVRTLTLIDAAIPGLTPTSGGIPDDATNTRTWHFAFNRMAGLPELLVTGREREFLAYLFDSKSHRPEVFDGVALDEYARILARPGALSAGMGYYRSTFSAAGLLRSAGRAEVTLSMPVLTVGAESGVGSLLGTTLEEVAPHLRTHLLTDCGHYVPEERPAELARLLIDFWTSARASPCLGRTNRTQIPKAVPTTIPRWPDPA